MQILLLPSSLVLLTFTALSPRTRANPVISTITVTATSPAIPTSTSFTSDSSFQGAMLAAHNFYRMEHNVSALSWNSTCAKYAASWAGKCAFRHSGGPTGENLAAGYSNASASVNAWGLERESYNWAKPGFSETTGHFTQLVWSNTTSVGCGRTACNGKGKTPGFYVVCEYYPPGNVVGDNNRYFIDNVKRQIKGKNNDTLESGVQGDGKTSKGRRDAEILWRVGVLVLAGAVWFGMVW